jgi:GH35 family endo-1,4-beta-xylanase
MSSDSNPTSSNQPHGEEWRGTDEASLPEHVHDRESQSILAEARANIPKLRQRDFSLRIVDCFGQPIRHTRLKLKQLRQAFPFGDQTWALDRFVRFNQDHTDKAIYWKRLFAEVFNHATTLCYWTEKPIHDGPKTEDIQGHPRLEAFDTCCRWAASEGLGVKGHPLFWSIDKCIPSWLDRYDIDTFWKFAEVRVRTLIAQQRGRVNMWDAVNEALWEASPQNLKSRHWPHLEPADVMADYIARVLGWCHDEAPESTFILNDYGLEADPVRGAPLHKDGSPVTAARQRLRQIELIKRLRDRNVQPDAIGLQAHTAGWISPRDQWSVYDQLTATGLPIHITEFWAPHDKSMQSDPSRRAEYEARVIEYVEEYLTLAFGHPSVEAFFFWGFMEHAIDWNEHSAHLVRPIYHRVRTLLRETWMSSLDLTTDADGVVRGRAFFGDYAIYTIASESDVGELRRSTRVSIERGASGVQTVNLPGIAARS